MHSYKQIGVGRCLTALALFCVFLAGCVPTAVHPFYKDSDLVQDASLLGVWKSDDGKNRWTFTKSEGKSYTLEIAADEERVLCVAHLFKIGNERFLDLYPSEQAINASLQNNPYSIGLIPTHAFIRVRATEPKLRLSGMALKWLKDYLTRNPEAAAHVFLPDDRVALTGGTEAMQGFIKKHIDTADAWNALFDDGLIRQK